MFEFQQKLLKTNLRIFVYHAFGTIAGTKINYPGIRHKKQTQGVNNKPNKNFELKEIFKPKREVFQPCRALGNNVGFSKVFSIPLLFFFPISNLMLVKSVSQKVTHNLFQES